MTGSNRLFRPDADFDVDIVTPRQGPVGSMRARLGSKCNRETQVQAVILVATALRISHRVDIAASFGVNFCLPVAKGERGQLREDRGLSPRACSYGIKVDAMTTRNTLQNLHAVISRGKLEVLHDTPRGD